MSHKQEASGEYKVKGTGQSVNYEFSYDVIEGATAQDRIDDAIETLGVEQVAKDLQRIIKVDANNTAREKAKVANGHSTRIALTEEQKAENKKARSEISAMAKLVKGKGLSLEQLKDLLS